MQSLVGAPFDALAGLDRLQPVVPFAFAAVRLNPPMNAPQVTPLVVKRSPMLLGPLGVPSRTVVPAEQTSPVGSRSPTKAPGPVLFGTTLVDGALGVAGKVLPATKLSSPGVDGPKIEL